MNPATQRPATREVGAVRRAAPRPPPRSPQKVPRGVFRGTGRGRSDHGFGTVELVLLVPAIVLAVLLVVAVGRVEQARLQVTGAARDSARAASLDGMA